MATGIFKAGEGESDKEEEWHLVPVGPLTAMHFPDDYIAAMGQPLPLH